MRRRAATVALAVVALLASGVDPIEAAQAQATTSRVLLRFDAEVPSSSTLEARSGLPRVTVRRLGARSALVTSRTRAARAVAALRAMPGVESATPDRRVRLAATTAPFASGARSAGRQWDLWDASSTDRAGGWGTDAPRAWTRTLGDPRVVVAVLDTGITPHPDLAGASIAPGHDFVTEADGIGSGDGDGWDADPTDEGDACAATGEASSWHGTFVAGEIVARHDGRFVAGAAPGVTLLPVRVLGACGGAESDTIAAITWASGGDVPGVPAAPRRADVISMSLGSSEGACSAPLQAAVDGAIARGTTVIAAAGNDGGDVVEASPANCSGVISVAAATRRGVLAAYSNRGSGPLAPTLAAPGGSATDPVTGDGWTTPAGPAGAGRPVVVRAAGTSMAAPLAAAAAALLLSAHPGLSPAQVARRLTATATRFPARSGCRPAVCGAGVVNAGNAVGAPHRFVRTRTVRLTGAARPGGTLSADAGGWKPAPDAVHYRWLRDGRAVPGATTPTFTVRAKDLHHRLAVRVTAARAGATPSAAVSVSRTVRPA